MSVILIIFITRYSTEGVELTGQFTFVFYISSIFSTIGNYGGRIYQVSDYKNKYSDEAYIASRYVTSLIMVVCILIFTLLNHYDFNKIMLMLALIAFRIPEAISDVYYGIMQKHDALEYVGRSMSVRAVLSLAFFIVTFLITKEVLIASLTLCISYTAVFIKYDRSVVNKIQKVKLHFSNVIFKLLKDSMPIFLFAFCSLFILNITRYGVDLRLDDTQQGYFSMIILPASFIALFAQFIIQPMIKRLVDIFYKGGKKALSKDLRFIFLALLSFGVIVSIVTFLVAPEIMNKVYGVDVLTTYRIELVASVLSGIIGGGVVVLSTALTIMRRLKSQLIGYVLSCFVALFLSIYFVQHNITEAVLVYLAIMIIQLIVFAIIYMLNDEVK